MQINNEVLILEVRKMKSGLMTYSTGQKWEEGESEYKRIRELLLQDKNLRSMIPSFVIKYRDLGDYWDFIKVKFGHYSERKKYLVEEFSQLFDYFEFNDQNNEYSGEIKKKLIQWLSEANEFEIVKNINSCEFIFEPYLDFLIPVNGDIPYDPYILIIRAPRKAYDLLEEKNGVKQKIFNAVNALLQDHDALIEIKVSPLVGDTVFSHQSFSAIKTTTSVEIQETWKKLLDRVSSDPEGSITTARALVEGVCKYILDQLKEDYTNKEDLSDLYKKVANKLSLAPENHQLEIYKHILGGCRSVVDGLASLRNALGDAHGKGQKAPRPSARHAKLAVNLAVTMALFLMETYEKTDNDKLD